MPGTTRYSATFDRTYEEEDPPPPVTRRSRSLSLQVESRINVRSSPLATGTPPHTRSSSTENGAHGAASDAIPTRNAGKTAVKTHNNPFQFVKVASVPIYRKNEDQLKKLIQSKPTVLKEEDEEEWQSNLDSWKCRRRKMSESAFQRQEELRRLQLEEQSQQEQEQQQQKKIKKFSEMVEGRAHRGRALSLCLFSNPLESSEWIFENSKKRESKVLSQDHSGESAGSSNINSEDENDNFHKADKNANNSVIVQTANECTNNRHSIQNSTSNSSISKNSDLSELDVSQDSISAKEQISSGNGFIDSGLESLSSSHRAGDIADSGSDFSQDSVSSIDCDSPRASGLITTGVELLEEFCSKEDAAKKISEEKKSTAANDSKDELKLANPEGKISRVVPKKNFPKEKSQTTAAKANTKSLPKSKNVKPSKSTSNSLPSKPERSAESENEMYVDDFEELARIKTTQNSTPDVKPKNSSSLSSEKTLHSQDSTSSCPLNIIYQSSDLKQSSALVNGSPKADSLKENSLSENNFSLISEIPVDKVTEEMERLILQQLEEEERAKEMFANDQYNGFSSLDDKNVHELPVKNAEPPKEKPPPPPSAAVTPTKKDTCVKRVNSTKRILKEIHKRRTDFLGIEGSADNNIGELVPPSTAAVEKIMKAEREHDRQTLQNIISSASSSHTEDEIAKKEQEIIENLENEEKLQSRQDKKQPSVPDFTEAHIEEEKIKQLKEEKKKMEEELRLAEAEKVRMEQALVLQKREEQIKHQEDGKSAISSRDETDKSLNVEVVAAASNSSLVQIGDGQINPCSVPPSSLSAEGEASKSKKSPPTPPPKPVKKKKEAIRKERERLRQEQEELQREREELRKKVQLEQEQLRKNEAKLHVPEAPKSRVGPPPPEKPTLSSQVLTSSSQSTSSSLPNVVREVAPPAVANKTKKVKVPSLATDSQPNSKQSISKLPPSVSRPKAVPSDVRPVQKMPTQRKQEVTEPRYNQNHWLIQEAEMRRIAEQKERQRSQNNPNLFHPAQFPEEYSDSIVHRSGPSVKAPTYPVMGQMCAPLDQRYMQQYNHSAQASKCMSSVGQHLDTSQYLATYSKQFEPSLMPPAKPSRVAPFEKQEQVLSVSGRKKCSHCDEELGRGAAMIIESLQLYYHIHCFHCCVCQTQLGNGSRGTDVRVRNKKLHCHNCYSNDEAGLKFSQV